MGYVTQQPSVYDDLTARENLGYFARLLGCVRARVEEVRELVRLVEVRHHIRHQDRQLLEVRVVIDVVEDRQLDEQFLLRRLTC